MKARSSAPGPRGRSLLRTILGRRSDPIALLVELKAEYGDIVEVRLGDMRQFLVSDPEAARHVLVQNHKNYSRGPGHVLLRAMLGEGLVTSEGDHWRSHRKIIQPLLARERLSAFVPVMVESAAEEAAALGELARKGLTVDVFKRMNALTLSIAARTLLGSDVTDREAEVHRSVSIVLDHMERLSTSAWRYLEVLPGASPLRWIRSATATLPTPSRKSFNEAIATLDDVIYEVIARRREFDHGTTEATDLVALLRAASCSGSGPPLTDEDVRDEIMTMFIAGYETTSTALTWCLYLLARHPEHQLRIAQETDAVLGGRPPTLTDLPNLVASRKFVEEALRLYPPVWRIGRHAVGYDRIAGYDIPPGSVVTILPYLLHRDPTHWPDPERFDPDRFDPGESRDRVRGAYLPFGAGQRMCPGSSFATAEIQIILATVCRGVAFELEPGFEPAFAPRVTLRPKGGMPLRLVPPASMATSTSSLTRTR